MARDARWLVLLLALILAALGAPGAKGQGPDEPGATPILDQEAVVLAALEETPDASAIPLRARAFHFPDVSGGSVAALVADLPEGAPTARGGDGAGYTQDFTVLALVRDAGGEVVFRSSQRFTASRSEGEPDLTSHRTLFERETLLSPGRYSVEIVARDAQTGALGVARLPLEVPATTDGQLRLSSLMVVGHGESRPLNEPSPRFYDGVQLYPNLGDPVSLSEGKPLPFLFTLRPGARPLASATVEVIQDGKSLLQSPVALPTPDASGQMTVVGGLQVGRLEPGDYTLRLSVASGHGIQSRTDTFTLVP